MSKDLTLDPNFRVELPYGATGATGEYEWSDSYLDGQVVTGGSGPLIATVPGPPAAPRKAVVSFPTGDPFQFRGAQVGGSEPPYLTLRLYPTMPAGVPGVIDRGDPIVIRGRPHEYPAGSGHWDLQDLGGDGRPTVVSRADASAVADLLAGNLSLKADFDAGLEQIAQITGDYQGVRIGEDALYLDGAQAAAVVLDSAGQVLEYTDQSGVKHLPHGLEVGALRLSVVDTDLWIDGERPAEIVQDSAGRVVRYTTLDGRTVTQSTAAPAVGPPANLTLNATGDSMTEGLGSSTFRQAGGSGYPGMLATLLGRPVNNLGSAGQTAAEIAARTARSHNPNAAQFIAGAVSGGVYPLTLQHAGNGPLASDIYREQRGRLDGVPGLLFRAGNTTDTGLNTNRDGAYQFRPDTAVTLRAAALTWVPSVPPAQYTLAWLGRNNADDTAQTGVAADAIRASLPLGARYIEIGILAAQSESTTTADAGQRANLTRIRAHNARRAGLVGRAFFDPNTVICVDADGTPRADGSPNPDYMADNLHCNDAGYRRIAQALAALIRALEADLYWSVLP